MSQEPFTNEGFAERWAAWQARGAANDRATTRNLRILGGVLVAAVLIVNIVWWL